MDNLLSIVGIIAIMISSFSSPTIGFLFGGGGGGGCGCAPPPPPCLPPIQLPPLCLPPLPRICLPPPPPLCLPQIPLPSIQTCCPRCPSPCRFRSRRAAAHGTGTVLVDPTCNAPPLRKIMRQHMKSGDTEQAKRLIFDAAHEQLQGKFDVICANGDFSYSINTEYFCQETIGNLSCYSFKQL